MKPPNLTWMAFMRKNWELTPCIALVVYGMATTTLFTLYCIYTRDYIVKRGKYPWDRMDLLRNPYHRKILRYNECFDQLPEMQCLYNEMDKAERDLVRKKRKEAERDLCD